MSSRKVPHIFYPDLNQISNLSTDFRLIRAVLIHADGRKDSYNDANMRFSLLMSMGLNIVLKYLHFLGTEKLRLLRRFKRHKLCDIRKLIAAFCWAVL